jgi:hypothetical protein
MKFKILLRNDGQYEIHIKRSFFHFWEDGYFNIYQTEREAKDAVYDYLIDIKKRKEKAYGRKIREVVEIIDSD